MARFEDVEGEFLGREVGLVRCSVSRLEAALSRELRGIGKVWRTNHCWYIFTDGTVWIQGYMFPWNARREATMEESATSTQFLSRPFSKGSGERFAVERKPLLQRFYFPLLF